MVNEAVLIGMKEISTFMRVSEKKIREWRKKHKDMPIFCERDGSQLCADKERLAEWQRTLYSRQN